MATVGIYKKSYSVKKFSELNIKVENEAFVGKKIDKEDVFDQQIILHDYRVVKAKYQDKGCTQCLHLQISIEGKMRVVFFTSNNLIRQIEQVSKEDLPRETVIVNKDKKYSFT